MAKCLAKYSVDVEDKFMKRGILCRGAIKAVVKAAAVTVGKVVAVAHGARMAGSHG